MSGRKYTRSTNPFDDDNDDDVDDELFLRNSRRSPAPQSSFDEQLQSFHERKKAIEDRTLSSAEKSISILRDSEQIGIATAEELLRQREKLEKTDRQLDDINATLRFSQKHINGIKSVFSSLKNYVSGRSDAGPAPAKTSPPAADETEERAVPYDRFEAHPTTRLRQLNAPLSAAGGGGRDFSARLDANLHEMSDSICRLKNLASDMTLELDQQNDLISTITDKTEAADLTIHRQNKDIQRLLKK